MGDSDDSPSSSDGAQGLRLSPALTDAILGWVLDGQPHLEKLLSALHEENVIIEPIVQTMIFSIMGGYSHHFSACLIDTEDIEQAHYHALGAVMQNPHVTKMTETIIQSQVSQAVKGVIE